MFLSAFNHQLGIDGHGLYLIGRVPAPVMRWPLFGRPTDPMGAERGFLHRYRAFLLDELEDVHHRITDLQGANAR
ncbi:MAG: hypothetical protein H7338_14670 [Candidatus Sericytochromatia bacterium]|nr:hypothetical protein [Candidatus Sericytochromatia bacterium]